MAVAMMKAQSRESMTDVYGHVLGGALDSEGYPFLEIDTQAYPCYFGMCGVEETVST